MRILWWSNAPWCRTGYGRMTAEFTPLIRDLGHEVAIGAFHGLHGGPLAWQGIPVYPGGRDNWGLDILAGHYRHWRADVVITLMDPWVLHPGLGELGLNMACWCPVDCSPLGAVDRAFLEAAKATPIAMSRHGERMIAAAGLSPLYVPHGVDTAVFSPPEDRAGLRREMGLEGRFVIGICAANQDKNRKGFVEQFRAFAQFRRSCREALLLVHTVAENEQWGGRDLRAIAERFGISGAVRFCEQYDYLAGMVPDEAMARWYGALDVLSNCSWGEGFGLPVLEAQACGTPVIVTSCSSMPELRGPGWQVQGEPFDAFLHEADWVRPSVRKISRIYHEARLNAGSRRARARQFALTYDAKRVLQDYWVPVLAQLESTASR